MFKTFDCVLVIQLLVRLTSLPACSTESKFTFWTFSNCFFSFSLFLKHTMAYVSCFDDSAKTHQVEPTVLVAHEHTSCG